MVVVLQIIRGFKGLRVKIGKWGWEEGLDRVYLVIRRKVIQSTQT